jgi:ParB family transcriptional regulator, chromosome partitioning protein
VAEKKKKKLGKGLGALLGEGAVPLDPEMAAPQPAAGMPEQYPDGSRLLFLDPSALEPNPKQPRRIFEEEALQELADSIGRDGLQEPVIARERDGKHELISGERRVRASIMAGLDQIPVLVRDVSDRDMLKLGLIENIQREDLNAIEVAQAYRQLVDEFGWTQEELSREVGKKRATVANMLRLLSLPEAVQDMVGDGSLSMGHARAVLAIASEKGQIDAARRIIRQGLSVRQAEKLAAVPSKQKARQEKKDPNIEKLENDLRRRLGTKVHLKTQKDGRGRIEIEYYSLDELERLLEMLRSP